MCAHALARRRTCEHAHVYAYVDECVMSECVYVSLCIWGEGGNPLLFGSIVEKKKNQHE